MGNTEYSHNPAYEKRSQEMLFDLEQGIALINDLSNEGLKIALIQLGYSEPESHYVLNALRSCQEVGEYVYMEKGNPHGVIMWEENSVSSEVPLLMSIEKLGDGINGWIVDVMYDEEKYDIPKFPHQIFSDEGDVGIARFFIVKFADFDTDPKAIAKIVRSMTDVMVVGDHEDDDMFTGDVESKGMQGEFTEVTRTDGGSDFYKPLFIESLSKKGFVLVGMGKPI